MYTNYTTTPIYDSPALRFPIVSTRGAVEIPLHITEYRGPVRAPKLSEFTVLPNLPNVQLNNTSYGGTGYMLGPQELSKITLAGYIDTPMQTTADNYATPLIAIGSYRVTYADLLAYYYEGRWTQPWQIVDPTWFRDGFGRVFSNVIILDFTASYIEAVPGRTNYTMVLKV